jgi:hypothetical protein
LRLEAERDEPLKGDSDVARVDLDAITDATELVGGE